ncbi:MAG: hypothetical protein FJZ01_04965 [Candidatus Sericytochromatia bacterium]|nr:hypothetical protein [Candidatus Tanganyikabacteria bacterium]
MTQRLPQVHALLSHPGAAEALLPVLRAIPPHRAAVAAVAPRWPGVCEGVPAGPGPLLASLLPTAGPICDVLLVHADPWHPLAGWAAAAAGAVRERGGRILAIQRGAFYGDPPPPSLDPDYLLARGATTPDASEGDRSHARMPWDGIALWGPAFAPSLPPGARHTIAGSPVLERIVRGELASQSPRMARHAARMEVTRVLGLHPSAIPVMIATKLHGHWWPEDRVAALLAGIVEGVRKQGLEPFVVPHPRDGAEALRVYRDVLVEAKVERPVVVSPRHWRKLEPGAWYLGVGAVVSQGGAEGVLAAALGTPALAVVPPDTPYWAAPVAVPDGHYRVVRDPLAYVRDGVDAGLAALSGKPHDPLSFREHAIRAEGAAEQVARAALDLTHRRRKARPTRTAAESRPQVEVATEHAAAR